MCLCLCDSTVHHWDSVSTLSCAHAVKPLFKALNISNEYRIILCRKYLKYIKVVAKPATLAPFKDSLE